MLSPCQLQSNISWNFRADFHRHWNERKPHAARTGLERLRLGVAWAHPLKRFEISATVSVKPKKRDLSQSDGGEWGVAN